MAERLTGKVEAVLVGSGVDGTSTERKKIQVFANRGVNGEIHYGSTRLMDVRERELKEHGLPKGIEIANFRQFSAISEEELKEIAKQMGLSNIPYGLLGENLVVSGIDNLTQLPSGSMFLFRKNEREIRSSVLVVWRENTPCEIPAINITEYVRENLSKAEIVTPFQIAAYGKRGIVGTVYSSGTIHKGDEVEIKLP